MKVLSHKECESVTGGSDVQPLMIGAGILGIALLLIGFFPL